MAGSAPTWIEGKTMLRVSWSCILCITLTAPIGVSAGIPEPDALLYGNVYVAGVPVFQRAAVVVIARLETGQEVGRFDFADCNADGVRDTCELSCGNPGCAGVPGCGTARDANGDGQLDDCPGNLFVLRIRCESTPAGLTASGQCASGPNVGQACNADADCGKVCSAVASNAGATCGVDADCLGGTCDSRGCPLPAAAVLNPADPTVVNVLVMRDAGAEHFVRTVRITERGKIRHVALSVLDMFAHDRYADCQRGPAINEPAPACEPAFFNGVDYDDDGDVDLRDFAVEQSYFVGQ